MYIITRERAEEYLSKQAVPAPATGAPQPTPGLVGTLSAIAPTGAPAGATTAPTGGTPEASPPGLEIAGFQWTGEISPQKWMNFYTKVLSRFATAGGLKLTVTVDVEPPSGVTMSKVNETKVALRELGLPETINARRRDGG